ncbi:hypothetical protein DBIPINDM_007466 (plasmid) [Mesorhizobium sp. AR02]|uniref:hypothetical protein n=1 Tax=Mesorhizobium sp. AR02 TaxID=2865837 RepID=UPI002160E6E8|nr:hypothetical protein [Mesorhizobium sp. AR02]UVK50170.1 hypothetical protein DBIPINDM_007466 [Mesorhizobium sp. AR02]
MCTIDIHLTRADGSICTAKLIGFLDWATGRVWCDLIAFDTRGGVNNRDVIEVFAAMVEHPAFGLPEALYMALVRGYEIERISIFNVVGYACVT